MFAINATISNLAIITVTTMLDSNLPRRQGRQKRVSVIVEKKFWSPARGGRARNLYTKSKSLTRTCRVTWVCSVTVNLCNRQIIKIKNTCNIVWSRQFVPASSHHFLSPGLPVWHEVAWFRFIHTTNIYPVSSLFFSPVCSSSVHMEYSQFISLMSNISLAKSSGEGTV